MPQQPLFMIPGVSKSTTDFSLGKVAGGIAGRLGQGRAYSVDKVRWVAGFPEKIGGWVAASSTTMLGTPRAEREWLSAAGASLLAIGTETHLYVFDGSSITDITPLRTLVSGTATNKVTTTIGSTTVSISDTTQTLHNGDHVFLSTATAVGGITLNGWYTVQNRSGTGYDITVPVAATSSAGPGGGTLTYQYPRTTLANPFTMTSGSPTVQVTHVASGASAGEYVVYSGASASHGLTIDGEYQIQTIIDPDNYTITASGNATSSGSGGGSVSVIYEIVVPLATSVTTSSPYGSGPYGVGPYSAGMWRSPSTVSGWTLAAYGALLLAAPIDGTIYVYDPVAGGRAYPLLNAPTTVQAIIVTPERFVVALGINGNPLTIAWCDQTDFTVWTASPTNTANDGRTLQGGSYFVGGVPDVNGASLILTNKCAFEMLYTGTDFIYNTPIVSDNAGLISPWAICAQSGVVYWMSDSDFWMWNGATVALPSDDIRDYVFQNINKSYAGKCNAGLVRSKKEVWFFYPSASATECDSYVIYSIAQGIWSVGTLNRTAWHDSELFAYPMACNSTGTLFQQETGTDDNGAAMEASIFFPPVEISNGDRSMDVFGFYPDFQRQTGIVELTILTRDYPQSQNTEIGPFTLGGPNTPPYAETTRLDLRTAARLVGFEMVSNVIGGDFRLALPKAEVQPAGARR